MHKFKHPPTLRLYRPDDAAELSVLFRRSVEGLGRRAYSPRQVAAWARLTPSPERLEAMAAAGRTRVVAADHDDRPVAFADLEPDGHIALLYVAPEAAGRGVGTALCDVVEETARLRGLARLYSEASELARPVFVRRGFTLLGSRDIAVAGVAIRTWAVEKRLSPFVPPVR